MARFLLSVAFVALALLGASAHSEPSRRKTLGFGPNLPHSRFETNPPPLSILSVGDRNPHHVAKQAIADYILPPNGSGYVIRKDSYTDPRTGVTRVFVRQIVNGLEVVDGDANINVKDGRVLSYGNSFYPGPVPSDLKAPEGYSASLDALNYACENIRAAKIAETSDQLPVSQGGQWVLAQPHIEDQIPSLCHSGSRLSPEAPTIGDPRRAVLQFMAAATPDVNLAADIIQNIDSYTERIYPHPHFDKKHEFRDVSLLKNVPGSVDDVKVYMAYAQTPMEKGGFNLSLVWKMEVEMKDNWYEVAMSADANPTILSVVDWASDSPIRPPQYPTPPPPRGPTAYYVYPWGINDPSEGERALVKEPHDILASPLGWHSVPNGVLPGHSKSRDQPDPKIIDFTTTFGNNVFAHENWQGANGWLDNYRPDGGKKLKFDFPYDPKPAEDKEGSMAIAKDYINATVTQLFYTSNMVHDLYYRYGFDEVSGNFQQHNFGRGGEEGDAVIANAQDGSGFNNANFMTPPDGQNGKCRMYLWNTANPYRDGDLEAGIVIHELSHGLSTRLTGGPDNSGCLGWGESGGMGEGWGDFLATTIRSNKEYSDYAMGAWAANRVNGIRNYIYSTNSTVNPSTYKTLDKPGYWGVHAIGEVWAEILWVVLQKLIVKHGYTESLFPPQPLADGTVPAGEFYRPREVDQFGKPKPLVPKHGNSLMVQLVLDGMKLQQCRPSFFDARDAIIQADDVLTGGENFCELWEGFAERGLGVDAVVEGRTPWGGGIRRDGHKVPAKCA